MNESITPKIVKGGFRATLALLLSIIALVFSVMAYNRTGSQKDLAAQVKMLQQKLETVKDTTTKQIEKIGKETNNTLKKFGIDIKNK